MSWATDGEPRFVVTSVTGYSLNSGNNGSQPPVTFYQVLDRPYCYALIAGTRHRKDAEEGAAQLNAGNLTWPHGFSWRLWHRSGAKCECEPCTKRRKTYQRENSAHRRERERAA